MPGSGLLAPAAIAGVAEFVGGPGRAVDSRPPHFPIGAWCGPNRFAKAGGGARVRRSWVRPRPRSGLCWCWRLHWAAATRCAGLPALAGIFLPGGIIAAHADVQGPCRTGQSAASSAPQRQRLRAAGADAGGRARLSRLAGRRGRQCPVWHRRRGGGGSRPRPGHRHRHRRSGAGCARPPAAPSRCPRR